MHHVDPAVYGATRLTIDHWILKARLSVFNFQIYFESWVPFEYFTSRNHFEWFHIYFESSVSFEYQNNYIWKLKTDNCAFNIQWSMVKRVAPYTAGSRRCNLCLEEKLLIMEAKNKYFLYIRYKVYIVIQIKDKT